MSKAALWFHSQKPKRYHMTTNITNQQTVRIFRRPRAQDVFDYLHQNDQVIVSLKESDKIKCKVSENDPWKVATVSGRAGEAGAETKYWCNVEDRESGIQQSINLELESALKILMKKLV